MILKYEKMKKINLLLGTLLAFIILGQSLFAQEGVISASDLAKIANQKDVVVVSARKAADYTKVHIKGAINIDATSLNTDTPAKGMMKSKEEITTILGGKGIITDSKIVLYCKTGVSAGRVYWILKYLGCKDVKMLDGQMSGWRTARKPVTKIATTIKKATFTPTINNDILATKSYVESKLNNASVVLVDARPAEKFSEGKIGNAVNIPDKVLLTEDHKFKSKEALQEIFNNAGVKSDKEVILYCKSGASAGLVFFVMKEILAYPNVKVYDGSYNEWAL